MDLEWLKNIAQWIRSALWGDMDPQTWMFLPDTVLIEIFAYLRDADRAKMAKTCKNWSRVFKTPSLWRKRHMELGGYTAGRAGRYACKFAEQYGKYLHYLKLSCIHPSNHTCKIVQRNIEEFLDKIKTCRLRTFDLQRLELDRFWRFENLREKVVDSISRFLHAQKAITVFDMSSAQCSIENGCKILDSLGTACGDVLQCLDAEDFFHSRQAVFQMQRFNYCIQRYTALNELSLNYNCLSDEILDVLSKNLKGKLRHMLVKVYKGDPHFHRISRQSWKQLTNACPKLSVEVWFESLGFASDLIPVLVPEMPVQDIHVWTGYNDDTEWNLADIINHVSLHYKKSLQTVSMELDNPDEYIDDALLRLMTRCTCLRELTFNAAMHVTTAEVICEMLKEKKIGLHLLHLTVCGLKDVEWAELSYLRERYHPIFAERNLNFLMQSDLMIDN